jgi:hypothetical protein
MELAALIFESPSRIRVSRLITNIFSFEKDEEKVVAVLSKMRVSGATTGPFT